MKSMQQTIKIVFVPFFLFLFVFAVLTGSLSTPVKAQFYGGFADFEQKSFGKKKYKKRSSRRSKRQSRRRYAARLRKQQRSRSKRVRNKYLRKKRNARLASSRLRTIAQQKRKTAERIAARKKADTIKVSAIARPSALMKQKTAFQGAQRFRKKPASLVRSNIEALKKQRKQKKRKAARAKGRLRKDPLQVVVSIPNQSLQVFRGTKMIASSRISSGKAGHRTPTGVYSIIQKNRVHHSNLYNSAPMPNMQRITWSGIALHAGRVPGYPASHGCIRLPYGFSRKLFRTTRMGAHVIVQHGRSRPHSVSHPLLFQPIAESLFADVMPQKKRQNWSSLAKTVSLVSSKNTEHQVALSTELFHLTSQKMEEEQRTAKRQALFTAMIKDRSQAPLRIFITKRSRREQVREIQKMLNEFGYDLGQPNGYFGKKTRAALYRLQDEENMDVVNGRITEETENYLRDITGYHLKGNGHLYIRQDFKDVFDTPVNIRESDKELGTHIFTAQNFAKDDDLVKWVSLTVKDRHKAKTKRVRVRRKGRRGRKRKGYRYITKVIPGKKSGTAKEALDRIVIQPEIRTYIARMLTPGTSITVSDHGYSNETGKGTDFVVKVH